ncbi:MAG: hypothetical protein JSR91_04335 [Proteobacteria bacterium]|nr:hypothetical protein [Pseudomonadota bacterium]
MIDHSRRLIVSATFASVAGLLAFGTNHGAYAQAPRPQINAVPQPMPNEPAFRDPKTGQVWTPANVGEDGKPLGPNERAFDPSKQVATARGSVDQTVPTRHVGTVPITAGPTVPLVEIDHISLNVVPGRRWRAVLYLNNNSASTFSPIIACQFDNGGHPVERTRGLLPPTAGGERVGMVIYGPRSQTFVDSVQCRVDSP